MRTTALVLLALLASASARAADLTVAGPAGQTVSLTRAELDALPPGPPQPHLAGPTLWSVLEKAGLVAPDFHARVRQTLLVTGQDGYSAALALGEIDPEFADKPVLLVLRRDDAALEAPRLAIPGDKRGGRSVHDVVRIELR